MVLAVAEIVIRSRRVVRVKSLGPGSPGVPPSCAVTGLHGVSFPTLSMFITSLCSVPPLRAVFHTAYIDVPNHSCPHITTLTRFSV